MGFNSAFKGLRMYTNERHAKHYCSHDLFLASASDERETPDLTSVLGGNS